jgi:hypothetical protein
LYICKPPPQRALLTSEEGGYRIKVVEVLSEKIEAPIERSGAKNEKNKFSFLCFFGPLK